jgi:hypothetical protein
VVAIHVPSGTQYVAVSRASGAYTLLNLRVGGPFRVTATRVGSQPRTQNDIYLTLGETRRLDFVLAALAQQLAGQRIVAVSETETVRTGASITVSPIQVVSTPSAKRSTRDLTRLDSRRFLLQQLLWPRRSGTRRPDELRAGAV